MYSVFNGYTKEIEQEWKYGIFWRVCRKTYCVRCVCDCVCVCVWGRERESAYMCFLCATINGLEDVIVEHDDAVGTVAAVSVGADTNSTSG